MTLLVPWNAAWTAENRYEVRPCKYAGGRLAVWQPFKPGEGSPIFAKPHSVRQRQSVARFICTVCGKETPATDRWWFKLGAVTDGYWMTTEAPVHHDCAQLALRVCPHLRGRAGDLEPFPDGYSIAHAIVGGSLMDQDFGLKIIAGRTVVGALKFAWPIPAMRKHGIVL
jgi:hypothetical protein